jgi:hypothetical protein
MRKKSILMLAGLGCMAVLSAIAVTFTDASMSCATAQGNACASACRAAHNECRIATKGSSSCDAQFAACMQGCLKR